MKKSDKKRCPHCGQPLSYAENFCPYCGGDLEAAPDKKFNMPRGKALKKAVILTVIAVLLALLAIFGGRKLYYVSLVKQLSEEPYVELVEVDTQDQLLALEPDALWRDPDLIKADHQELTEDQKLAVQYLCEGYFNEGASKEDCLYYMDMNGISSQDTLKAIECCQVDFMAQALRRALNLLGDASFGPVELAERLEKDGFTPEEVDYAVENCGADWAYETELQAIEYLYYLGISRENLTRLLIDHGHDPEVVEDVLERLDPDWNREALQRGLEFLEEGHQHYYREQLYDELVEWGFEPEQSRYAVDLLRP